MNKDSRQFEPTEGWLQSSYKKARRGYQNRISLALRVTHPELFRAQAIVDQWIATNNYLRICNEIDSFQCCTFTLHVQKRTGTRIEFLLTSRVGQDTLDCLFECCLSSFYKNVLNVDPKLQTMWTEFPVVEENISSSEK